MHFVAFLGLSAVISGKGAITVFFIGLLIAIIWLLPAMSGTYLFANRSIKVLFIDATMYIVLFALSGLFLGIL